jgi:hypothetical protein
VLGADLDDRVALLRAAFAALVADVLGVRAAWIAARLALAAWLLLLAAILYRSAVRVPDAR